jgi:ribonuclease D
MRIARDPEAISSLVATIRSAGVVAFDTEFLWEKTYWPLLCLVQVAVDGVEAIADPLATDVTPLWEAIADAPVVVTHAGDHDLDLMYTAIGRTPDTVFDTQVAGAFLGYGDSAGYTNLVQAALGRRVRGGEGYTDWSRRPLDDRQLEYAIEDVRHLGPLHAELSADLERRGRHEWASEETRERFERIGANVDPMEAWRRVKGSNRVKGKALAVLQSVSAWREEEAMRRDEARRRVVPDQVLIEIAKRAPTDPGQISRMRGLHQGQARRVAGPLADTVRAAVRRPESEWPRRAPRPDFAGDPAIDPISAVLHGVLRMQAKAMDLAPGLLGTRSDLDELVRLRLAGDVDGAPHPLLHGWRRRAVGDDLLHLLEGSAAIRISVDGSGPALSLEE